MIRERFEIVPLNCTVRAVAALVYHEGNSAPHDGIPTRMGDSALDQTVAMFREVYDEAARVHAGVGDVNTEIVQAAADAAARAFVDKAGAGP